MTGMDSPGPFPKGFRWDRLRGVPEDGLAAQRARDARAAQLQHDRDEEHAQALERDREERKRPTLEAEDEQFRERAERLLNVSGLRQEMSALRAEIDELRKVLGAVSVTPRRERSSRRSSMPRCARFFGARRSR